MTLSANKFPHTSKHELSGGHTGTYCNHQDNSVDVKECKIYTCNVNMHVKKLLSLQTSVFHKDMPKKPSDY